MEEGLLKMSLIMFLSLQISYQHKQVQTDFCVHDVGTLTEECEIDLCEVVQPSLPKKSLLVSSFGMLANSMVCTSVKILLGYL